MRPHREQEIPRQTNSTEVPQSPEATDLAELLHHYVVSTPNVHSILRAERSSTQQIIPPTITAEDLMTAYNRATLTATAEATEIIEVPQDNIDKKSLRKFVLPSAAAGIALVSVFNPTAAAMAHDDHSSPTTEGSASAQAESSTDTKPQAIKPTAEEKAEPVKVGTAPKEEQLNGLQVAVGTPKEKKEEQKPVTINSQATDSATTTVKAEVATPTPVDSTPVAISTTPTTAESTVKVAVGVSESTDETSKEKVVIISSKPESGLVSMNAMGGIAVPETAIDENGLKVSHEPVKISAKPVETMPEFDRKNATPEQSAIYEILKTVKETGDTSTAASLIRENFHDKSIIPSSYNNGKPVYETTNPALVENIGNLTKVYKDLIGKGGHADAAYVDNSLTALAVFEAVAHDQSVLNSPDVQQLIAAIKKPEDAYKGKLFDQYLAKTKEAFDAENGKLLRGINDPYKPQLETLYTHVLMANVSTEQQGKEIQAIKDAEAAEAARKAAEEANIGKYDKSAEAEALQRIIDRAPEGVEKRTYKVFQFLMQKTGLNLQQVGGIVGNMLVESASTMDPSIKQFGGGPGRGMVQWEGGRWVNLQNFAAARGTSWDDFYTQLEFLVHELPGRQNTLEVIRGKGSQYEAARAFMILFETPYTVVKAYNTGYWGQVDKEAADRSSRADGYVSTIINETKAVNQARAEAEAKAKAEAAKRAMTFNENEIWLDSTQVPCPPGLKKWGDDTGYHHGEAYRVGLCELPSTYDRGKDGPGLVNVRAAGLANAMFEQMKKDLGLKTIVLNDSYRTMQGQIDADRRDKDQWGNDMGGAASPGWSAHQSGYAFDINMGTANGNSHEVGYTAGRDRAYPGNPVWEWLKANAHKYHFYQWPEEGWHWSINGK